jgi:hypothetical protein
VSLNVSHLRYETAVASVSQDDRSKITVFISVKLLREVVFLKFSASIRIVDWIVHSTKLKRYWPYIQLTSEVPYMIWPKFPRLVLMKPSFLREFFSSLGWRI